MAVIQITLMSVHWVQWSTYQTFNLNFSVQLMVLRPWHWAQPLMPGRTSCRRACSGEYSGKYCGNKGRGPIKDISPLNTLISCSNSSIEVLRTNLPTLVRRCALGSRLPSADVCQLQSVRFISSPDTDLRSFSSHGIPLNQHLLTPSHTALHLHNFCLHCPQFQPS